MIEQVTVFLSLLAMGKHNVEEWDIRATLRPN